MTYESFVFSILFVMRFDIKHFNEYKYAQKICILLGSTEYSYFQITLIVLTLIIL